jgi:PAS domain S-box-containing protein
VSKFDLPRMSSFNNGTESDSRQWPLPAADRLLALSSASDAMLENILHQDYEKALASVAKHVHDLLNTESCAIFLVPQPAGDVLELKASYSDTSLDKFENPGPLHITDVPKGGLTGFVASQGNILRLHGPALKNHPNVFGRPATHLASNECFSLLAIPIKDVRGRVCGVVKTDNKKGLDGKSSPDIEFNEEDISIARILANKLLQILDSLRTLTALRLSESLYHSLVENMPQFMSRKDVNGRITFANESFCRLVGLPLEKLRGKTDADLYPKELADSYRADDLRVIQERCTVHREEEHKAPTRDEPMYVEVTKVPILGSTGEVIETQCIFWDITKRKRQEAALEEQRRLIDALMWNIPDRIYFKDRASRFTLINHALAEYFGLESPAAAVGQSDFDFFQEQEAKRKFADEQKVIATGEPLVNLEERDAFPNGAAYWVLTTKMPLKSEDGTVIGTFGISRDITENRQTEHKLRAAVEEKQVLLREVHHRIKNNFRLVMGVLNMQARSVGNPTAVNALKECRERLQGMVELYEEILSGEDMRRISMVKYMKRLIDRLFEANAPPESRITVRQEIDEFYLDVDTALACAQITNELVTNAFKHAFPNGRIGHIDVRFRLQHNTSAVLTCADNGIGLPVGLTLDAAKSLGMQLVSILARQLKSTVSLHTRPGTEFTFTFPIGTESGS